MREISIAHKSLDPSLSYSIAFVIEPSMGVIGSDGLKENSNFRGPVDRRNSEQKKRKCTKHRVGESISAHTT